MNTKTYLGRFLLTNLERDVQKDQENKSQQNLQSVMCNVCIGKFSKHNTKSRTKIIAIV